MPELEGTEMPGHCFILTHGTAIEAGCCSIHECWCFPLQCGHGPGSCVNQCGALQLGSKILLKSLSPYSNVLWSVVKRPLNITVLGWPGLKRLPDIHCIISMSPTSESQAFELRSLTFPQIILF